MHMEMIGQVINEILGIGSDDLTVAQTLVRAVVVYGSALLLVRLGEKRFLGKSTAFDMVVAIMLGSVVSRGITGSADLAASLGAGAVLVGLHWLGAVIAFRSDRMGDVMKGTARMLIKDGELQWDEMRKSNITRQDLQSGLRNSANVEDPERIAAAYLERSGDITALKKSQVRVIEIDVKDGVQTVRIELAS
jgi:uncharacterized membrane protein YcaP (DUF421 family)